jgi:hypothetical protein
MLPFQSCHVVPPPIMHIPTSTGKLATLEVARVTMVGDY